MRNQTIPAHHRRAVANAWASDAANTWSAWCRFLFSNPVTAFLLYIDIMAPACRKFLFSQDFRGRGANRCAATDLLCVQGLEGDYLWCKMAFFWLPSIPCISLSLLLAQQEMGVMGFLPFKMDGRRHFVSGSPGGDWWDDCCNISLSPCQALLLIPHVVPRLGHVVEEHFCPPFHQCLG